MPLIDPTGKPIIPHKAKLFPLQWRIGEATVILHSNGSCEGDLELALEELDDLPPDPNGPLLWLLAHAIRTQIERRSRPDVADTFFVDLDPAVDFEDTPA